MPNILDNVVRALRPHKTLMDRFQQLDGLVDKSWYRFQKAKLRENGKSKDYMDQYYGDVDKLSQSLKDEWTRLIDDVNPRNDGNLYLGYIRKCLDRGDRYNDCKEKFPKYIKPFVEDFEMKIKTDPSTYPFDNSWHPEPRSRTVRRYMQELMTGDGS